MFIYTTLRTADLSCKFIVKWLVYVLSLVSWMSVCKNDISGLCAFFYVDLDVGY